MAVSTNLTYVIVPWINIYYTPIHIYLKRILAFMWAEDWGMGWLEQEHNNWRDTCQQKSTKCQWCSEVRCGEAEKGAPSEVTLKRALLLDIQRCLENPESIANWCRSCKEAIYWYIFPCSVPNLYMDLGNLQTGEIWERAHLCISFIPSYRALKNYSVEPNSKEGPEITMTCLHPSGTHCLDLALASEGQGNP